MGKNHLKRLAAPKMWNIKRKGSKLITKPSPGSHSLELGMPLGSILKEVLGYAATTREAKKILSANNVKIDGKIKKDFRLPVGLFDTVEFSSTNEYFRVILNKKGKLDLIKVKKEEALVKPRKVINKTMVGGKLQLNLNDGKNVIVDKNAYKVGDTVILADQKVSNHFRLGKKSSIFLIGGKHGGTSGIVEDIIGNKVIYKDQNNNLIATSKQYVFVVGDSKPVISLEK